MMTKPGRALCALAVSLFLSMLLVHVLAQASPVMGGDAYRHDGRAAVPGLPASVQHTATVLVDDFEPQPLQGETVSFYNRLGGDRGRIDGPGSVNVVWGNGVVTASIYVGSDTFVGVFTSLSHPIIENIPLDFSSIFPAQIEPQFQGRVIGLRFRIADGQGMFKVELQAPHLAKLWENSALLSGGPRDLLFNPPMLGEVRNLNWLVVGSAGDFVAVDQVELIVELPQLSTSQRAFLWSYGMLLSNWISTTGLTRDRANFPAGDFDNVSASGMQAAAAVLAWRAGLISEPAALEIVTRTTEGLMRLPRCNGLLPHFVRNGQIVSNTEWSSLDTVLAAVPLLQAREALGLDAEGIGQLLTGTHWLSLSLPNGHISHGYNTTCTQLLQDSWYDFGTETWLANFGYAAGTGQVGAMDSTPPTFNGSGFIDELAWLLVPAPPRDLWLIDWPGYRQQAADKQLTYYQTHPCYGPHERFGLSAAEAPDPSLAATTQIYQAFGVGGEIPPKDGTSLLGHAVIVPHYAAMIASHHPTQAVTLWEWLEQQGLFTPLNNVESLMFVDEPACQNIAWNSLKGSWNLSLQTLGWGGLLLAGDNPLYESVCPDDVLRKAYAIVGGLPCKTHLPFIAKNASPAPFALVRFPNWFTTGILSEAARTLSGAESKDAVLETTER